MITLSVVSYSHEDRNARSSPSLKTFYLWHKRSRFDDDMNYSSAFDLPKEPLATPLLLMQRTYKDPRWTNRLVFPYFA